MAITPEWSRRLGRLANMERFNRVWVDPVAKYAFLQQAQSYTTFDAAPAWMQAAVLDGETPWVPQPQPLPEWLTQMLEEVT